MTGPPSELVKVTLRRLPLDLYRQSREHQDELQREFTFIQQSSSLHESSVPHRLIQLMLELNARFGAFSKGPRDALDVALDQGVATMDVVYQVPPEAKEAAVTLGVLLDEADEFCRNGTHLLTLATPPGPLALRRWYLGEFVAQIDGADPTPWDEWESQVAP